MCVGGVGNKGEVGCVSEGRVGLMGRVELVLKGWGPALVGRKGSMCEHDMSRRLGRGR